MKVGGQILWNVTPICETSQICYLMGRRPMKDVLGNHLKDRLFHLVHWLSIILQPRRTSPESTNLERKSYLDCSSRIRSVRGGNLEGWRTDRRPWGVGNDGRIGNLLKKDSMRKRWYFPNKENLLFQSQMDESKLPEKIRNWEHQPWYGSVQFKEKVTLTFGASEGSLPPPHDSFPDAGEAISDFWFMSGNFIYRHHVEPRVKLYSPREESFPIPRKYIDVSRKTHTNLDVRQEKRIDDYWNVDGSWDLSDLLEEKLPNGYMWSERR